MKRILEIEKMQRALNESIYEKFNIDKSEIFDLVKIAFLVELSELANELRVFKYWSMKPPSDKKVVLEEYVDCIHFLMSLGILMNFKFENVKLLKEDKNHIEYYLDITSTVVNLTVDDNNRFHKLFNLFISYGDLLGFDLQVIYEGYIDKNKINYDRLAKGY